MIARFIAAVFAAFLFASGVQAREPVSTGYFTNTAIGGKDTLAYHLDANRRAHVTTAGSKGYSVPYLGADWHFASRESADKFAAAPATYAPLYNGHCANALSSNEGLIATDGTLWEFFGDQLFLFYGESGRQRWLHGDWKAFKVQADAAWKDIVAKSR
jgi:hypothetical protein